MNVDTKIGLVNEFYGKACSAAEEIVVELARGILRKRPDLDEFIMAMGTADFFNKEKNWVELDSHPDFRKLYEFISAWDRVLKITGMPMRFTADGPIVRDW
jgi:hypothetical protein